jgi:mannosyltransferase OCH1-like enzyme
MSEDSPPFTNSLPFPPIIHQVWFNESGAPIPKKWETSPLEWRRLHPNWQYRLWSLEDARDLIREVDPEFLPQFDRFPAIIMKCDAIRPIILKHLGGLYTDLDIVPRENVEKYFREDGDVYLVGSPNYTSGFSNCMMASKPNSPFWDRFIEEMKKSNVPWWALTKHWKVMYVAGPMLLNRVAKEYEGVICRMPMVKFYPVGIDGIQTKKDRLRAANAAVYNASSSSWSSLDTKIYDCIGRNRFWFLSFCFFLILLVIVLYFKYKWQYRDIEARCIYALPRV